jgi:putative DNA primase/helicase
MTMADQLARNLGAKKSGNQYLVRCPAHEDRHPSCIFWQGHTAIRVKCNSGCYAEDIIAIWRDAGVWPEQGQKRRRRRGDDDPAARIVLPAPAPDARALQRRDWALSIWSAAHDPKGTPAEKYLASRGLSLSAVSCEVVRFHPACPRSVEAGGARGCRQPAMISLMRDIVTDRPMAIHRRYLTPDGARDGKPLTLGPVGGCAIKLTSHRETFGEALGFCSRLNITEGFETGLRLLMAGYRPLWALGAAGEIRKFPPLFAVGELAVWADHDKAGILAAQWAVWQWREAGKRARAVMPDLPGCDFADPQVWQGGLSGRQ